MLFRCFTRDLMNLKVCSKSQTDSVICVAGSKIGWLTFHCLSCIGEAESLTLSRRVPCFLTVMHSNPVSPLRASATLSSNRSRIKRRCLSTSRINHQLKSLRGSRILKPVAAACAVGWTPWHLWSCGNLSKCKPYSARALTLGTGGSCGAQCSGWVILRVQPCIIQHFAWRESVRLTLSSRRLSFSSSTCAAVES